jgi:hypothetical protein
MSSFLGLFDWIPLREDLRAQFHEQEIFSGGKNRELCPISLVGGHDICGWSVAMQVFRYFDMMAHLVGAFLLIFALPYQLYFNGKVSARHKRIGKIVTVALFVQAFGGGTSLVLQAFTHYIFADRAGTAIEKGYVLTLESKFVFLPMFSMGFVTPIMNGLAKMAFNIPYKVSAIVTLLSVIYALGYAYPVMIRRMLPHNSDTYDFQILFELVVIAVVYPLQDIGNSLKYYALIKKGEKFDEIEHHLHNCKMLTVVAFTAVLWFAAHQRIVDGDTHYSIPTFYRIVVSFIPFLVMVFTGSFGSYMKYFYGLGAKDTKSKSA